MHKYRVALSTASEYADYTREQILKLIDSSQESSLERKDYRAICRELLQRNHDLELKLYG